MRPNERWARPVYPVFMDEKTNGSDKMRQAINPKKRPTGLIKMLQTAFESN